MRPFKSSLARQMEEYISYRLSLGYTERNLRGQLRGFDQYVCDKEAGQDDLRPPFFLELKKKFKEKPQTFNAILLTVRGFFNYLVRRQIIDENPLIDICSYTPNAFIPFVFSPDQIDKLLSAIQSSIRKEPMYFFKDYSVYMSILLLARCGMRISEPLRLKPDNYRGSEGTIYIEKTKFSKDRLIAVPNAVINEMDNYLAMRKAFIQDPTPYLLPGQNGHTLSTNRIYKVFGQAVKDIGINQPRRIIANTTFGNPRPHSLRHSFAINTLKRIKQQGKSPQNALPILAVYLG
ncbi:MAG: tyrosine-type recombinase/integrase, partial [Desulfobacteraceae bacterium]|nr:tyrosine-type recombinase/integrase [Desulfobacteraceae bacterium]MBC2720366.1 tyrosine-type recombinase/integrase [Desulfobacteraceae bacterium]